MVVTETAVLPDYISQTTLETLTRECESPIEFKLGIAFIIACVSRYEERGDPGLFLIPQYEFGHYRFDFAITGEDQQNIYLFIECDGHDFHERTKEQAAHDRQKDRFSQINGVPIFRYTGSEIWSQPDACAHQVLDFVERFSAL